MRRLIIFLIFLLPIVLFCQEKDFQPIVSEGKIPEDFLKSSADIIEQEKEDFTVGSSRKEKKIKEKFLIESTYGTKDLLQTGIITFNDPVSLYINKVADNLLKNDVELKSKLRFYAAKMPDCNAMAFNNGIILVNIGLIAQLENESQLAFILAHEISHYINQDAIDKFIEYEKIAKGKGFYSQLSIYDKEIEQAKYSQIIETRADKDGLEIFLNSEYDRKAIVNVYDILKYSYLPIDEIPFDKAFIEAKNYKIPDAYLLEKVSPINVKEIKNSKQTHPNTSDRKESLLEELSKNSKGGTNVFLQDENQFFETRKLARFELSRIYLKYGYYEEALYNSYVLLKLYPDDYYLKKNVAKCLSAIAMHFNNNEKLRSRKIDIIEDIQGESQQLYYIIDQMRQFDEEGFNVLALSYIYELYKQNLDDLEMKALFDNLVHDAIQHGHLDLEEFKKSLPKKENTELDDKEEIYLDSANTKLAKIEEKSKIEKIEKQKEEQGADLYLYGFIDYLNEDLFVKSFETSEQEIKKKKDWDHTYFYMSKKEKKRNQEHLDIKKLVVIDPFYTQIAIKKDKKYEFIQSDEGELDYTNRLKKVSQVKKIELDLEIVDFNQVQENEVELLNDLFLAKEWFSEQVKLDDNINFSSIELNNLNALIDKYGSEYFLWTGVVQIRDKNALETLLKLYGSIFFPPALAFTIPNIITSKFYTLHFNIVKNIRTGETVYSNVEETNYKTKPALMNAKIFAELYKISKI